MAKFPRRPVDQRRPVTRLRIIRRKRFSPHPNLVARSLVSCPSVQLFSLVFIRSSPERRGGVDAGCGAQVVCSDTDGEDRIGVLAGSDDLDGIVADSDFFPDWRSVGRSMVQANGNRGHSVGRDGDRDPPGDPCLVELASFMAGVDLRCGAWDLSGF